MECRLNDGSWNASLLRADKLEDHNEIIRALFSDPAIKKAVHGAKDLCRALLAEGIQPGGIIFDTEVAAYLLAPGDGSYELEKLGLDRKSTRLNSSH